MNPYRLATLALLVLATAFRLWFLSADLWELSAEEAQYWEWSRRLDWSYYSKGPGVAYLIALATSLGGHSALAVRLPAVILGLPVAWLAYRLAREAAGSEGPGFWAVAALTAMPLYAAGSLLMTTDTPLLLAWAGALYAAGRAADAGRGTRWWHAAGLALAAGLLTKYTILLLIPCLLGFLLTHPRGPDLLRGRGPWIAGGWLAAGSLPILLWNWRHDWVSFRHVLGQAGTDAGGGWRGLGEFLGVQAGVASPLLFVVLLAGMAQAAARGLGRREPRPLLLFWASAPVLLFFLLWSARGKVQGNWPAPAYFAAAVAAAAWAGPRPEGRPPRARRPRKALLAFWGASIILGVAIQAAALVPGGARHLGRRMVALAQGGVGAAGPGARLLGQGGALLARSPDPCKRVCGWRALAARVEAAATAMPGAPPGGPRPHEPPFIVSDRYQLAALLAFYAAGHPRTFVADLGRRLNQYDLWGGLEGERGRNGIFVTYGFQPLPPEVGQAFDRTEVEPTLVVSRGDSLLHGFAIVRGFGFRGFPPPAGPPRY